LRLAHSLRSFITSQHVGYICGRKGLAQRSGDRQLMPKDDLEEIH